MKPGDVQPGSAKLPSMTSWLDVLRAALPPRGVLLVGAGAGDGPWVQWLHSRGVASEDVPVLLVEGDEQQYRHLQNSLPAHGAWTVRRDVVAASRGNAIFHRATNPTESGLLKPESLRQLWAHLGTEQSIVVEDAVTLDALEQEVDRQINWLVLDCLPAASLLQAGVQLLPGLDVALVRVAQDLSSELAADQQAVDELMRAAGLRCVHTQAERHPALAHALYVCDSAQVQAQARRLGEQLKVAQEVWAKQEAELAQVKQEREERSKLADSRKEQIEQLEAAKAVLEQTNAELGGQIAEHERLHKHEQGLIDQCRRELVLVKEEKEKRNKVANNRKKQIEQLEAEKAELVEQLAKSQRATEARQAQIRQLEQTQGQARQQAVSVIAARWARAEGVVENWGDKLNPYLINALSQKPVAHVDDLAGWGKRPVQRVIGSGLGAMQPNEVYWGMGLIRRDIIPPQRAGQICAVRGPLSRHRLLELDISCPEVYGDPAVLLPLVFRPEKEAAHEYGVVQHFREASSQLPVPRIKGCEAPKVIDIRGGIEKVVKDILSCRTIISSSLHGVIASHAYGRKAYWLKASDLPLGDDFKFRDYWASIGHAVYEPVLLDEEGYVVFGKSPNAPVPGSLDVDALLAACPFITEERCEQLVASRKKLASLGARGTPFSA